MTDSLTKTNFDESTHIKPQIIYIKQEPGDFEDVKIKTETHESRMNYEEFEVVNSENTAANSLPIKTEFDSEHLEQMTIKSEDFNNTVGRSDDPKEGDINCDVNTKNEDICSDDVKVDIEMNEHNESTELVRWYQCKFCPFKTKRKYILINHSKVKHIEVEWFQCGFCPFKTKIKPYLERHAKYRHFESNEWQQCEFCDYKTKDKRNLNRHVKCNHNETIEWQQCKCCDYKTKDKGNFSKHVKYKHQDSLEWHQCQYCDYKTRVKGNLRQHFMVRHDANSEWFQCQFCEYKTKVRYKLTSHSKMKHNRESE